MPIQKKKVLVIGHIWPEPNTTAAGHHMMQLLNVFKEQEYHITFASTAARTKYSLDLFEMGIHEIPIRLNHPGFDDFVQEMQPNVVIFDRFMVEEQFGWRVTEQVPNAIRVLNTEDLHSLRHTREACLKKNENFTVTAWKANDRAKREIASIYRSDMTLLVSDYEIEVLQKEFNIPQRLLLHFPFLLEAISGETATALPKFGEREGFVCFGNGRHAPNVDSIRYLKKRLWPKIRQQLSNAQLQVYGAYLPEEIQQFQKPKEGFYVNGWVEDLDAALQTARINLAPLRFGAGIKGKLVDAIRNGLPSVTTQIGAEGMHGNLPWAGSICNTETDFIKKAVQLHQHENQWLRAQQNGFQILDQRYNKERLTAQLLDAIATLEADLENHRHQNFMGQLLQHQTMAASRFMGKWIEAKNK